MDYDALSEGRVRHFGTGAMIVMDDTTCMVKVVALHLALLHTPSPVRPVHTVPRGYGLVVADAVQDHGGQRGSAAISTNSLLSVANKIEGHTICALR